MRELKFESILVFQISNPNGNSEPDQNEVEINFIIQLSLDSFSLEDFKNLWADLIENNKKLKKRIKTESSKISTPDSCPKLGTLKSKIPTDIWEASDILEDTTISAGKIQHLSEARVNRQLMSGSRFFTGIASK